MLENYTKASWQMSISLIYFQTTYYEYLITNNNGPQYIFDCHLYTMYYWSKALGSVPTYYR